MSQQFDASRIYREPPDSQTIAQQERELDELRQRPIGLSNAKLHAQRDLEAQTAVCNRIAWGGTPRQMREPEPDEVTALLEGLNEEDRDKLMDQAMLVAAQRHWLYRLEEAEERHLAEAKADQEQRAQAEAEAREWAEFEADDAAGKQERFKQWRAAKQNG